MPGREPGAVGHPPVLGPLGVGERLVRRARTRPPSRSSSRRGTAGRSRCPGRSGRDVAPRAGLRCSAAPDGRASRGSCERPSPPAGRERERGPVAARPARCRPDEVRRDHCPSMYASPAPVSPRSSSRTAAAGSWTRISARRVARSGRRTRGRAPSGRTTVRRPIAIRSAAARRMRSAVDGDACGREAGKRAPGRGRSSGHLGTSVGRQAVGDGPRAGGSRRRGAGTGCPDATGAGMPVDAARSS